GSGRGAELGVLFRRGDALQKLAQARVIAFDKTGTLTEGRPRVTGLWAEGIDPDAGLRLMAAAEARSEHPLATAILSEAEARGLTLPQAEGARAHAGRGLAARVEGHALLIGNGTALDEAGIALAPALLAQTDRAAETGATPVHLAVDGRHCLSLALADTPRPEAAATIAALHAMGLETAMLSGDVPAAARAVGRGLGIDRIEA
ncbi:MAG: HAD-IC family P-type ATPase, partial [Pararhodobacter sp.]